MQTLLSVREFRRRQRATWARLKRVNRALARWDEWECAEAMPEDIRPHVEHPALGRVEHPALGRAGLKQIRATLPGVLLAGLEAWEALGRRARGEARKTPASHAPPAGHGP